MASTKEYLEFVLEGLSLLEEISSRPMMGEYIIYYRGKIIGGIYDNRFLVKPTEAAVRIMPDADYESPYEGAKKMLAVNNIEDKQFLKNLFTAMYPELPFPKKHTRRIKMNKENIIIRRETPTDYREVENLVRESFWNVYRPGCLEHYVLKHMRSEPDFVPELDFVMEKDGRIIGQNVFYKTVIKSDDGRDIPIMTMGPICIAPELKRQGYGKILLDYSLEKAAEYGCKALCFEGNIQFYGKSGFDFASKFGIRYHGLPEGEDSSFFLLKELESGYLSGITGEYATPKAYFAGFENPEDFEAYDATFPEKEKLKLPGQLE